MGRPLCERIRPAFQKSFADATVEDIEHKGTLHVGPPAGSIYRAAVTFSNGVVVVFGGGRPEVVPPRLRAQDRVDHPVNRALGSSCRIAASSKPPPSSALTTRSPGPLSGILRGRCRRRTRLGVRCRIEARATLCVTGAGLLERTSCGPLPGRDSVRRRTFPSLLAVGDRGPRCGHSLRCVGRGSRARLGSAGPVYPARLSVLLEPCAGGRAVADGV
jgi:hypothetical protein